MNGLFNRKTGWLVDDLRNLKGVLERIQAIIFHNALQILVSKLGS